jgi:cyclopropane-fatty-acyl-phospholipid synthase
MGIASVVQQVLGPDIPLAIDAYDGTEASPPAPIGTIIIRSPDAIRRFVTAPGELGLARAYVAGDIDFEGDLFVALAAFSEHLPKLDPRVLVQLAKTVGWDGLKPIAPPPEEYRKRRGVRHSKSRDATSVSHHYNVSNEFYRLVLGPSLTYSCALWETPEVGLEAAQAAKHELICQKLRLHEGQRLLDVGCGWGSLALHAARHHGVRVVGVTVAERQAELAGLRVKEAGLEDRVEIRLQDYRDVADGPFDAISSVGMFEHVGRSHLATYFDRLYQLLRPEGRLMNHGISRRAFPREAWPVRVGSPPWERPGFIDRFVFPDGELHEVGTVVSVIQQQHLEVRHVESLREHYALTLRAWVANLEQHWDEAVELAGRGRARVWRLYMAASAVGFEQGRISIHQVLAERPDHGRSGFALRPAY